MVRFCGLAPVPTATSVIKHTRSFILHIIQKGRHSCRYNDFRDIVVCGSTVWKPRKDSAAHRTRFLTGRFWGRQKAPQKPTGTMKKQERRGLTLAPGDYSRVCKQTVPGARIFSPHLSFRFFHQAGDSPARRPSIKKEGSALRLQRTKNRTKAERPERKAGKA